MKTYTIICEAKCGSFEAAIGLTELLVREYAVDFARVRDDADVKEFDAEQLETIATALEAVAEIVEARPAPSHDQTATKILTIHQMNTMAQQARDLAALCGETI